MAVAWACGASTRGQQEAGAVTLSIVATNDLARRIVGARRARRPGDVRRISQQPSRSPRARRRRAAAGRRRHVPGHGRVQPCGRRPGRRGVQRPRLCGRRDWQSRVRFRRGRAGHRACRVIGGPARRTEGASRRGEVSFPRRQPRRHRNGPRRGLAERAAVGPRRGRRHPGRPRRRDDHPSACRPRSQRRQAACESIRWPRRFSRRRRRSARKAPISWSPSRTPEGAARGSTIRGICRLAICRPPKSPASCGSCREELVDLVASGHTHAGMAHELDGTIVMQAFSRGAAFSRADMTVDRRTKQIVARQVFPPRDVCARVYEGTTRCDAAAAGKRALVPAGYEGQPVRTDSAIARVIAPAIERARAHAGEPLGVVLETPIRAALIGTESPLGNLFTDAMLAAVPGADVAINNTRGGLRADLPRWTADLRKALRDVSVRQQARAFRAVRRRAPAGVRDPIARQPGPARHRGCTCGCHMPDVAASPSR